jgi:hypothetical protein
VLKVFRTIEESIATPYFEMKYVAAAQVITRTIATALVMYRWARSAKANIDRQRAAVR